METLCVPRLAGMTAMDKNRKYHEKLLAIFLIALVVAGCDGRKSAEELFGQTASGVVVVLNEYYYELKLPAGGSLYFTGLDENGDISGLTADEDEVRANRSMLTGTAFLSVVTAQ